MVVVAFDEDMGRLVGIGKDVEFRDADEHWQCVLSSLLKLLFGAFFIPDQPVFLALFQLLDVLGKLLFGPTAVVFLPPTMVPRFASPWRR